MPPLIDPAVMSDWYAGKSRPPLSFLLNDSVVVDIDGLAVFAAVIAPVEIGDDPVYVVERGDDGRSLQLHQSQLRRVAFAADDGPAAPESDDWRLHGQDSYLKNVALRFSTYTAHSAAWDHDHCEFCGAKFAEPQHIVDALHAGYATLDRYRWICWRCFSDFMPSFGWTVEK